MLEKLINPILNVRKELKRSIATLTFSTALALSLNPNIQAQDYTPRVFDEPLLVEKTKSTEVSMDMNPRTRKLGVAYVTKEDDLKYGQLTSSKNFEISFVGEGDKDKVCSIAFNPVTSEPAIAHNRTFYHLNDSNWDSEQLIPDRGKFSWVLNSLAFNPQTKQPLITGHSMGDYNLYSWNFDGVEWNKQILDYNDAINSDLKFGSDNIPKISYTTFAWNSHPSMVMYHPIHYTNSTIDTAEEGVWDFPEGYTSSLALIPAGNIGNTEDIPCISYVNFKEHTVHYAQWNPKEETWEREEIDDKIRSNVSIVLDSSNNPILTYVRRNGDIKLARRVNKEWNIQKIYNSNSADDDDYTSVDSAITDEDQLVVAFATSKSGGRVNVIPEEGAFTPRKNAVENWTGYE